MAQHGMQAHGPIGTASGTEISIQGLFLLITLLLTMETIVPEYQSSTPVSHITHTSTV